MKALLIGMSILLANVATGAAAGETHDRFFETLKNMCGQKFEGTVVDGIESDKVWRENRIIMHVRDCTDARLYIPLAVGDNHSRNWVITKTADGLRLKHDHRHHDGTSEAVTMYGGDTVGAGTAWSQSFPVDEESKKNFIENGLDVSVTNTWTMSMVEGETFSYRLSRPGRSFQVDFDLKNPVTD